jgi:hypothetical protein
MFTITMDPKERIRGFQHTEKHRERADNEYAIRISFVQFIGVSFQDIIEDQLGIGGRGGSVVGCEVL